MKCHFLLASLLLAASCTDKLPGRVLAQGQGRGLLVAPGGGAVAFLLDARHPDDQGVPDDLYLGDLYLAGPGAQDGAAKKVGASVSTAAGSFRFSPSGSALALLAGFRFKAGAGELWVAKALGGAPRKLAEDAQSFSFAPQGERLAWVAGGRLFSLDAPNAEPRALADGVHTFAWSADGTRLAARAAAAAGGQLSIIDASSAAKKAVAAGVTDFAFAPDGSLGLLGPAGPKGGDRALSVVDPGSDSAHPIGNATSFAFAPVGHALLALSTASAPGEATGELARIALPGGQAQPLGARALDFRFTPSGDVLFLARYDIRSRAGTLSLAPAGGGPVRAIAPRVQGFTFSPQGSRLLYLVQKPSRGDFKLELWVADLAGGAAPRKIDDGVYGYEPSPDGALLYWKARCSTGPRSCSLFRAPLDGSAAPVEVARNVAGFDLSRDGQRLLVSAPHRGSARNVDLGWLPANALGTEADADKVRPLAVEVDPSARFLDDGGKRVAFAVLDLQRAAVYLAELP